MEDNKSNGVLDSAIKQAVEKLSEKGVDGCTTKDVILAVMGALYSNGSIATSCEVQNLAGEIKKCFNRTVGICVGALVSIVLALIFI
jgi:hypothetical protein